MNSFFFRANDLLDEHIGMLNFSSIKINGQPIEVKSPRSPFGRFAFLRNGKYGTFLPCYTFNGLMLRIYRTVLGNGLEPRTIDWGDFEVVPINNLNTVPYYELATHYWPYTIEPKDKQLLERIRDCYYRGCDRLVEEMT